MDESKEGQQRSNVKVDFRYFISLALQNKLGWQSLPSILSDFTPTLQDSKEVIEVLLKELEKLHSELSRTRKVSDETSESEVIEIDQADSTEQFSENVSLEANDLFIDADKPMLQTNTSDMDTENLEEQIIAENIDDYDNENIQNDAIDIKDHSIAIHENESMKKDPIIGNVNSDETNEEGQKL